MSSVLPSFLFFKTQIKDSENTHTQRLKFLQIWFRERERERKRERERECVCVCVCERENPRWRSHPYDGSGWGLPLDRKNWLERRGFWFECREMSLRSNHHRWWRWWSEEEPRRLGHGSLENRGTGSLVQANFPRLERSPPRFNLIMGVALLIRCCFSGFVASTLGCFVCFCCIFFGLLRKREL